MKKDKLKSKKNKRENQLRFYNSVRKSLKSNPIEPKKFGSEVKELSETAKANLKRLSERFPTGGKYMNFRIVMKFHDGSSAVVFTDKQNAMKIAEEFKQNAVFHTLDNFGNLLPKKTEQLTINLKNRPDVVIASLNRCEIRRAYGL